MPVWIIKINNIHCGDAGFQEGGMIILHAVLGGGDKLAGKSKPGRPRFRRPGQGSNSVQYRYSDQNHRPYAQQSQPWDEKSMRQQKPGEPRSQSRPAMPPSSSASKKTNQVRQAIRGQSTGHFKQDSHPGGATHGTWDRLGAPRARVLVSHMRLS